MRYTRSTMSDEFSTFRDVVTGLTARYPARFAARFDTLEEIDPSEDGCTGCLVWPIPDTDTSEDDLTPRDEIDPEEEEG